MANNSILICKSVAQVVGNVMFAENFENICKRDVHQIVAIIMVWAIVMKSLEFSGIAGSARRIGLDVD